MYRRQWEEVQCNAFLCYVLMYKQCWITSSSFYRQSAFGRIHGLGCGLIIESLLLLRGSIYVCGFMIIVQILSWYCFWMWSYCCYYKHSISICMVFLIVFFLMWYFYMCDLVDIAWLWMWYLCGNGAIEADLLLMWYFKHT